MEFYIFGVVIAIAVFDRLFMPPLDAYGRRPLVDVWVAYAASYVLSAYAAYQANKVLMEKTGQATDRGEP